MVYEYEYAHHPHSPQLCRQITGTTTRTNYSIAWLLGQKKLLDQVSFGGFLTSDLGWKGQGHAGCTWVQANTTGITGYSLSHAERGTNMNPSSNAGLSSCGVTMFVKQTSKAFLFTLRFPS